MEGMDEKMKVSGVEEEKVGLSEAVVEKWRL